MNKKVVLAGGTGFIGKYFADKFKSLGYKVEIISRQTSHISWGDRTGMLYALENAELLINLAGKSVDCRYNAKNKETILSSRTETTENLGKVLLLCNNPPPLWINSSTATIYRHAEDRPMTELNGEIGRGFSVDVAKAWESAFFSFNLPKTRQVALRIAIVLGKEGGVMTPLRNLVKLGLGGAQGPGKQMFSWIHIEDLWQIIRFLQARKELSGVFNCSSPEPIPNRELMNQIRIAMGVRVGLPTPEWLLKFGAVIIRTEAELILKSRWVIPERLEQEGYQFKFKQLNPALQDLL